MKTRIFEFRSAFECSAEALFAFHERADALALLTPPWAGVRVIEPAPNLRPGAEAVLSLPAGPVRVRWRARHTIYEPPQRFVDEQVSGPFSRWRHEHRIEPAAGCAVLVDTVAYALPLGLNAVAGWMVDRSLRRMFAYRHSVTRRYVEGRA